MTPNAEEILNANVVKIENFQSTQAPDVGLWWTAKFQLKSGQCFLTRWNEAGYFYTPDVEHNLLPEVSEISWKSYKMGFGGRGCGYNTEVRLKDGSLEDFRVYEKILTPTEIPTGRWEAYPSYKYLPMLKTAFNISYAYKQMVKIDRLVKKANRNMADVLALQKATYDLREYCRG